MAKQLQQLDLFGGETEQPVHIIAHTQIKQLIQIAPTQVLLNEPDLPVVSRSAPHSRDISIKQKRGRKSFASMDADIGKLNIPSADILEKKLYYPIGEVANWFNANTSLIRYWEKEFKQLQPRKTRKGDRLFRAQDIETLKQIHYLLREKKYSIEGAKTYLRNNKEKAEKEVALLNSLKNLRSFLVSLKSTL